MKINASKTGYDRDRLATHGITNLIWNHINAVPIMKVSKKCGFIDEDSKPQGLLQDIDTNQCNFVTNSEFLRDYWISQTYPYYADTIVIVTMNDETIYTDRMIVQIYPIKVWLIWFLIFIITVAILTMLLQLSISSAMLESLRVFTNSSTIKHPRYLSERIFFTFLLFVIFIMNTTMLSRLTQINTISEMQFVDSVHDLITSNLSIYGPDRLKESIIYPELRDRFTSSTIMQCFRLLVDGNNKIACLFYINNLRFFVYENRFVHVSKHSIFESSISFTCSKDWPLLSKINWILLRLHSGGIIRLLYTRQERYYIKDPDMNNYTKEAPLDMTKLTVSLSMLVVGWILGFFVLLLEIIAHYVLKLYNKKR